MNSRLFTQTTSAIAAIGLISWGWWTLFLEDRPCSAAIDCHSIHDNFVHVLSFGLIIFVVFAVLAVISIILRGRK